MTTDVAERDLDGPKRVTPSKYSTEVHTLVERARSHGGTGGEPTEGELTDVEVRAITALELAERRRADEETRAAEEWLATCPPRFDEVNLDTLDQPPEILDPLLAWLARARKGVGDNLVLVGPVGTGKSHAALSLARELHFAGRPMVFVPAPELLEALRPDGGADVAVFTEPAVLVLDDLGAERPTEWTTDRLGLVLNRRWLNRRPTMVTTNLGGPALIERYGPRLHDRLRDAALVLHIGGASRRSAPRTS